MKLLHDDSNYRGGASGARARIWAGFFFSGQIAKGQPDRPVGRLGQSTCLMVEKQCPFFLIKGNREDDMASGNPSFMCKGKTNLTKD